MKKKFLSLMLSMVMCLASFSTVSVSAATEVVPVYLNGSAIVFPANDAQPQIINNRTYVPIRATCDALGLSIDWNSKTETLTFAREGVVISHTMRSQIVSVNNEPLQFDTPSINRNNRTLMPIRMLGESIGATVDWNADTRSVHITTNSTDSSTDEVAVTSLEVSKSAVAAGEEVTFTAKATSATEKVKFVNDDTSDVIAEVSSYSTESDGTRVFTTDVKCKNTSSKQEELVMRAVPGTATEYLETTDAIKTIEVLVSAADEEDDETTVDSFESDYFVELTYTSSVIEGDYVKFTATTESDVRRVKVALDDEQVIIKDYDEDDDYRIFEGEIEATDTGSRRLKIDLYVDGDYEDINEDFKVTVKSEDDDDDDDSSSGDGEIYDVEVVNDSFYVSQASPIYVTTSTDIDYVEVTADDDDDRVVGRASFTTSKTSSEKLWTVDVTVSDVGRNSYTVSAYVDDDVVDTKRETFNGKKFSRSTPAVVSMEQKTSTIRVGEEARFTARVSGCVTELEIRGESGGGILGSATSSATSSTTKTITISFEIQNSEEYYTVYAYDESGDSSTYDFKIVGETLQNIEITDLDYDDDTRYEYGDSIDITIHTTNSCEKLWIEDNRGNKVSKTATRPDDEDGSTYIWEMSFGTFVDDSDKSSRSYTIVAQGESKSDTDEETITIYFK